MSMTRSAYALLVMASLGLAVVSTAKAQLTLNYDTANNKLWFTGTDTLTTNGTGRIEWWNGTSGTDVFTHYFAGNPTVPNLLSSTVAATSSAIDMDQDGTSHFAYTIVTDSPNTSVTLTGLGYAAAIGFGDFTGTELAVLNSLSGTTVATYGGTVGGNPLNLQAIPEPSTYAALFGVIALAGTIYWKRDRRVTAVAAA
jgi:hypothetical protein